MLKSKYSEMELYGVDAERRIIEIAKKKNKEKGLGLNFQLAFAEELPFKGNHFDATWCNLLLHHLPTGSKKTGNKRDVSCFETRRQMFLDYLL